MNVAVLLSHAARSFAGRPAVSLGCDPQLTYGDLGRRAAALATGLLDQCGLVVGDRVALAMTNCPAYLEVLFGVWHAGLCAVPINARLHQREFAYVLADAGARLCFATPDLVDTVAPLVGTVDSLARVVCVDDHARLLGDGGTSCRPVAATDPAWLFYTSGTTGRPKGATLTHRTLLAMALSHLADVDTITERDSIIHAAPMSHGSGLYVLPHVAKAANHVIPASGHFDPAEVLDLIGYYPSAGAFLAPTMVTRLVREAERTDADTAHLKTLVYGGGPMYLTDLERALAALGPKLAQIYGQGESPMTITAVTKAMHADATHPRHRERLASVGIARTGIALRVADEADREVPTGETGEVLVQGDTVMAGYWQNPEATAATLRGGWLHTGDLGALDEDGFLTLKDRVKDLIISGGANIYPREVEEILLRHDKVQEVAVVGRPHPEWGEEVVAFVVTREGSTVETVDLDRLCLDRIARYKRPRQYRFVARLPKNNYGKVVKTELRRLLAAETAADDAAGDDGSDSDG
jgi:long-chain acyl-CoA synthetase